MADTARIWIVPVDVSPDDEAACRKVLDEEERGRAAAFVDAADRHRFTIAHGVLRLVVGRELNTPPETLRWIRHGHGKPALTAPWSGLHTSLSRSAELSVIAVSATRPVGVDVQHLLPGLDAVGLSARFFAPVEADHVAAGGCADAQADRFARLFARKEAVVKAAGGRLWPNLGVPVHRRDLVTCAQPASVHRVAEVEVPTGFRAAVALAGPAPYAVEVFTWSTEQSPQATHDVPAG